MLGENQTMPTLNQSGSNPSSIPHWPGHWPGRTVVDLDNLGDPGFWIEQQIPDIAEALFGDPGEDDDLADQLADDYMVAASDLQFPLPSDFEGTATETHEMVKADFVAFIREWRRLALARKDKS